MSGSEPEEADDLSRKDTMKSSGSSLNSTPRNDRTGASSSASTSNSAISLHKVASMLSQHMPVSAISLHKDLSDTEKEPESNKNSLTPNGEPRYQKVTFVHKADIENSQEVMLPTNTTVRFLKAELAKYLKLQPRNIRLFKNGRKMLSQEDVACPTYKVKQQQLSTSVINLIPGDDDIVIEIGLDDSESETEEDLNESSSKLESNTLQSIITTITLKDLHNKLQEVAVMKTMDSRQYLGGYRNKRTGTIYYHAASQTEYKNAKIFSSRVESAVELNTRETQTLLPLIEEGVNTVAEKCTQMVQREVYIPAMTDRVLTARPYQPCDEKNKSMTPEKAARILQTAWKLFIKKKRSGDIYRAQAEERLSKQQFKGYNQAELNKLQVSLLTSNSFPSTRGDFYDLYTKVGEWKNQKVKQLQEEKSGFAYKVAIADVQKKELEGLLAVEEQRIRARNENLNRQDIMFLEGTARSRVRQYPKGNITIIDDLNIQRARNFKEQFASYTRKDVTKPERIEILSCMKNFLAEFEAVDLTWDLIELIDREIDMISMGIENKHLSILRKRFESLFINLAKNPEFNPQAKYYQGSVENTKKYAKYKCISCGKIMYPSQMFVHLRVSRFQKCMSCAYMHATATATSNLAPYKRILMNLRAAEQEKYCRSAVPFLLQPMGMYFLVNVLWEGKSAISHTSYLPSLKVTRWLPNEEWSMWNMILLTELEANQHTRIKDPLKHYSKEFILKIMNRNILGRIHFHVLADIDDKFRNRDPSGVLPKDHLLFTRRKDEAFLPKNDPHPCLVPSKMTDAKATTMKNACN